MRRRTVFLICWALVTVILILTAMLVMLFEAFVMLEIHPVNWLAMFSLLRFFTVVGFVVATIVAVCTPERNL